MATGSSASLISSCPYTHIIITAHRRHAIDAQSKMFRSFAQAIGRLFKIIFSSFYAISATGAAGCPKWMSLLIFRYEIVRCAVACPLAPSHQQRDHGRILGPGRFSRRPGGSHPIRKILLRTRELLLDNTREPASCHGLRLNLFLLCKGACPRYRPLSP